MKNTRARIVIVLAVLGLALSASTAQAASFSGSLSYAPTAEAPDGLFVDGDLEQWPDYAITLNWTVTNELPTAPADFPWHYSYTLSLVGDEGGGISHLIIETSPAFTAADITGLVGAVLDSVGNQARGPGNPGMPGDLTGLKLFPPEGEYLTLSWSFFCTRAPVWGDFFAKDGRKGGVTNILYNYNQDALGNELGFVVGDVDPTDAPRDGSVDFHILRPDTFTVTVPEPATIALLAIGGLALIRRRKRAA